MAGEAPEALSSADEAELERALLELAPAQRDGLYWELLAHKARGEGLGALAAFGELVFGKKPADVHRAFLSNMLAYQRTANVLPPDGAKTTWGTVIKTAWHIGKHPHSTNGICSAGDDVADDMTQAVADTIEFNPRWKMVFPEVAPDKQRGWSSVGYHVRRTDLPEGEWERRRYGDKNPTLIGGGVGSSRWNGVRITGRFTLDDMHDRRSKTQQKTNDDTVGFFRDTAEYRVTDDGYLDIMQTRWNPKDVVALVKGRSDFKVFEHPAIVVEADGAERSYWPERHSLEKLRAIRERSPIDFELVFQGNDRAVEGTVLKTEWLHAFPALDIRREWNRYFGIDFARRLKEILTKDDDPDRCRLSVWADTGTRLVLEDVFGGVLFGPEAEELFFSKAAIYRPKVTGIETNGASAKMFYLELLKRMRLGGAQYVIRQVTRSKDKGEYMALIAPYFASGQLLISDADTPGLQAFRAEWALFPRGHDDALDSAYNGWAVASHLLPAQGVPEQIAAEARRRATLSPARMIELAYR